MTRSGDQAIVHVYVPQGQFDRMTIELNENLAELSFTSPDGTPNPTPNNTLFSFVASSPHSDSSSFYDLVFTGLKKDVLYEASVSHFEIFWAFTS